MRAGMAILIVLAGWVADIEVRPMLRHMPPPEIAFAGRFPLLREALRGNLRVIVSEPNEFGLAAFYLPKPDADRLCYVTDRENAWRTPFEDVAQGIMTQARVPPSWGLSCRVYALPLRRARGTGSRGPTRSPPVWLYYLLARDRCVVT